MRKHIFAVALLFSSAISVFAQDPVNGKTIGRPQLYYGAAYYPEVWPESQIDKDIAHMKELNMNVMRMAEFAWSTMEPEPGKYNWAWLHRVIEKLHAAGIDVILGTPTATPPAWLIERHPEMMVTDVMGQHAKHGMRRDCNYASQVYRRESVRITEAMAKEFGNKPGVIGWQTDNEFSINHDYSPETRQRWHQWLKDRYGSIDKLNKEWSTMLWSQTYNKFEQVPMPDIKEWFHPSLEVAWMRFNNDMIVEYQDLQLQAIRKFSKAPITHDGMPGQNVDYQKLFGNLDFAAINNYHSFEAYDLIMSNYDRMRGHKKGMHWLFETAPNYSGGGNNGSTWHLHQKKGSMRAALFMNYALGAQGSMFWLWRGHPAGQEMTHGSVLNVWGKPAANYDDLKQLGADLAKTSETLIKHPVAPAEVAFVYSNESNYGLGTEQYANGLKYYQDWTYRFYLPVAQGAYLHRDVIYPNTDISQYKLLFLPLLPNIGSEFRARLKTWVEAGGTLVLGPMSGYRNDEWAAQTQSAYGDINQWSGIEVESMLTIGTEYRAAEDKFKLQFHKDFELPEETAYLWSEALSSPNKKAEVLATYTTGGHAGKPAVMANRVGKGQVVVLGTDPGKAFIKALALRLAKELKIKPLATGDEGVVIVPRKGREDRVTVVVNITEKPRKIQLNSGGRDLISGKNIGRDAELAPYQVAVIRD